MTAQAWIVGIVALLLGLALCFAGYRFFRVLIACWGLFTGFLLGANLIEGVFGPHNGFLIYALRWGAATTVIHNSWIWVLSVIVLTILGFMVQVQSNQKYTLEYGQPVQFY